MSLKPKITEKTWNPASEKQLFERWEKENLFTFRPNRRRPIFTIDTPPPYPSGRPWHIGAAAHYSQIDMIARTARMLGFEVHFPIGIDRNGLPVEIYTEKTYRISMHRTPRERFIELCRHALDDLEAEMIQTMKTMGLSGDFKHHYRTDFEDYRKLTQATFIDLWRRGYVYEANRPNNYCIDCGTTIADAEIEYEELPAKLVYMKFKVRETGETLPVASTRPELLVSCQAVIVHPDDARYRQLHHKHAIIPLYNKEVVIHPHPSARPEFGTGAAMICSYGDYTDVLLFRELGLREIIATDEQGFMTPLTGLLSGMRIPQAREHIIQKLTESQLVTRVEEIRHRTPMCGRSNTPIEIIPMKEYYLKQVDFKEKLRRLASKIIFHPDSHRQLLLNWIDSVTIDWPISRRRYYATEVPVWYCKTCGEPHVPKPGRYYQPWKDPAPFTTCHKCGGTEFTGDPRTFDTWMDSGISALYITRYRKDRRFHEKTYPTTLRAQGKDIVRTWLHYSILRCYQLTRRAPFAHAWIFGLGLDEHGRAMHRHLGNVVDPLPILQKYGGDSFRFWSAQEASLGYDFRCSEARIAGAGKFLTKLWNLSRFISSFPQPRGSVKLTAADRWILAELSKLIRAALRGLQDFNFYIPATLIREFIWNIFAAHYVEMVKARAYGSGSSRSEQKAVWHTLHTCLRSLLLLLAPIIPFSTDSLWRQLYSAGSVHRQGFPKPQWSTSATRYTQPLVEFNSKVWNLKKEKGLSLKDSLQIEIPAVLRRFAKDLAAMHSIESKGRLAHRKP